MSADHTITLRIDPERSIVQVEETKNGIVTQKHIQPDTLFACIKGSLRRDAVHSGILPAHCISFSARDHSREVALWYPELYADITYYQTVYPHFPLPRLVFAFEIGTDGRVFSNRLGVIKDETPRPETPMYIYPFSNVSGSRICVGSNAMPKYKSLHLVATLPNFILSLPNNDDQFSANHNREKLGYRDLLERLKDKPPEYYYQQVLVPNGKTLQDFICGGY